MCITLTRFSSRTRQPQARHILLIWRFNPWVSTSRKVNIPVRSALHFIPVEQVDAVLSEALSMGLVEQECTPVRPYEQPVQGQGLPSLRQ